METTAKLIIYKDMDYGYRWRLRSGEGATITYSERKHQTKSECARDIEQRMLEYPDVYVRDATVRGFEKQILAKWLALQAT